MFFLLIGVVELSGTCNIPHIVWIKDILNIQYNTYELFSLTINHNELQDVQYYLSFKVIKDNTNIIIGETEIFTLRSNEIINITPLSFSEERFKIKKVDLNEDVDTLLRIILSSGKLPKGDYIFRFELVNANTNNIAAFFEHRFEILDEYGIEALSPGIPFGAPLTTTNENPVFVWTGKCDSFRLTLAIVVNSNLSAEEILEKYKIFEKDFQNNVYMFAYPRNFPPLTPGDYIWRITGFVKTSSGTEMIHSMPLCFKVKDLTSDEIIRILSQKLKGDETIKKIREKNYSATGNIMLDTKPITVEEFRKILLNPETKIKKVRLK